MRPPASPPGILNVTCSPAFPLITCSASETDQALDALADRTSIARAPRRRVRATMLASSTICLKDIGTAVMAAADIVHAKNSAAAGGFVNQRDLRHGEEYGAGAGYARPGPPGRGGPLLVPLSRVRFRRTVLQASRTRRAR